MYLLQFLLPILHFAVASVDGQSAIRLWRRLVRMLDAFWACGTTEVLSARRGVHVFGVNGSIGGTIDHWYGLMCLLCARDLELNFGRLCFASLMVVPALAKSEVCSMHFSAINHRRLGHTWQTDMHTLILPARWTVLTAWWQIIKVADIVEPSQSGFVLLCPIVLRCFRQTLMEKPWEYEWRPLIIYCITWRST